MSNGSRRHFTPPQKAGMVRRHLVGREAVSELASEFQVQPSQIHGWVKPVLDQAEAAFQRQPRGRVFRTKGRDVKRKARDSRRKARPSPPSFDRVARQQSPTDEEDVRFPRLSFPRLSRVSACESDPSIEHNNPPRGEGTRPLGSENARRTRPHVPRMDGFIEDVGKLSRANALRRSTQDPDEPQLSLRR